MQADAGSLLVESERVSSSENFEECADQTTNFKSDFRGTKGELFNKLVSVRSQSMLVSNASAGNQNGTENQRQTSSLQNNSLNHDVSQQLAPISDVEQSELHKEQQKYLMRQFQAESTDLGEQQQFNQNDEDNCYDPSSPESKQDTILFNKTRSKWYTNEEVSSILTNFKLHPEWQTNELQVRPKSGAVLLYSREKVRYRQDGYCWKKRKNGRTTREDHMKLKVQGIECIYGCYVHSAILPTFHRRCYWLLDNPDIVLVHYLNQPPDDQNKMLITFNSGLLEADTRRKWTNEEIIEEIGSVFGGISQIQHTLNINFPAPTAIIQQIHQPGAQVRDQASASPTSDGKIEMMESQFEASTSEPPNEMALIDQQQQQQSLFCDTMKTSYDEGSARLEPGQSLRDGQDEKMTTMRPDDDINNNNAKLISINQIGNQSYNASTACTTSNSAAIDGNQNCTALNNQSKAMTFDIVDDCFGYTGLNTDGASILSANVSSNIIINQSCSVEQVDEQMEQSLCSPVTQIYNKIVDDIETYALPLEPSQFDADHHHLHHHHHHDHQQNHLRDQIQHGMSISSLPTQSMEVLEADQLSPSSSSKQQSHRGSNQRRRRELADYVDGIKLRQHYMHDHHSRNNIDGGRLNRSRSTCSMDLATECDLFNSQEDHADQCQGDESRSRDGDHLISNVDDVDDDGDDHLLTDFNLQTSAHQEDSDLNASCVVDSLAGADELHDLIMGISPDDAQVDHGGQLVGDSNPLDIFNFKLDYGNHQSRAQIDMQSSTSDTETMSRISPLAPVPRCNSTGNAMQSSIQIDNDHLSGHNYIGLTCDPEEPGNRLVVTNTFDKLPIDNVLRGSPVRSLSTNAATNSVSQSPTPSTSSLQEPGSCMTAQPCSLFISEKRDQAPSSHSFIRLPPIRQQRQKSDQRVMDNNSLNSLLPKAISLDGNDLSATSDQQHKHRFSTTPLIPFEDSPQGRQQEGSDDLPLISQASSNHPIYSSQTTNNHQLSHGSVPQQHRLLSNLESSISPTTSIPTKTASSSENLISSNPGAQSNSTYSQNRSPTSHNNNSQLHSARQLTGQNQRANPSSLSFNALLPILDYVPNWSNITGGAKVLLVGNWSSLVAHPNEPFNDQEQSVSLIEKQDSSTSSPFCAVFDDLLVPATLIQDNVLRCYAPSHEQGFITLKVLYMDQIVSEQVLFEMRPSCVQSATKQAASITYPQLQGNQCGQDPSSIENNRSSGEGPGGNSNHNQQQQHRHSTSSNQSASSSSMLSTAPHNQRPQVSPLNISGTGANFTSPNSDNLKVLTLAENIISAMHKKNNTNNNYVIRNSSEFRLANSLDIESLDHYQGQLHNQSHGIQRNRSIKAGQRYLTGSRSLSRDSEPVTGSSSYAAMDFQVMNSDPYWHQNSFEPTSAEPKQPLPVISDSFQSGNCNTNMMFHNQERHSICSSAGSSFAHGQQSSAFLPYVAQRPNLGSSVHQMLVHCLPNESQNITETSSSGLGSIVSSLSPSTSSLHSPSSVGCVTSRNCRADLTGGDLDQFSACSCGRQSGGTPTSADFCEYFQASAKTEESFASLTLNDHEQHELYLAAKIIQKAYRTYRGRKRQASELLVEPSEVESEPERPVSPVEYQSGGSSSAASGANATDIMELVDESVSTCAQSLEHHGGFVASSVLIQPPFNYLNLQQQQKQQQPTLVRCYRDREMQAATIIQAYYRRYRQYVQYKRQQAALRQAPSLQVQPTLVCTGGTGGGRLTQNAGRLVVDTLPIVLGKATTSHVDRKRFKTTAILIGGSASSAEWPRAS